MNSRFYSIIITSINCLLILLWTYAAVSKLSDYHTGRGEMLNQALPEWLEEILVWGIPSIELVTVALLLFHRTRVYGTLLSLFLLISFTIYIAMVKLNYFDYMPCSCGGVIGSLNWEQHFVFNMAFIMLAATAVLLENQRSALFQKLQ